MSSGTHPSPHRLQPARGSGTAEPIPACRMGYSEVWLCLLCPFFLPWADQSRLLLLQYPLPPPASARSAAADPPAYCISAANCKFVFSSFFLLALWNKRFPRLSPCFTAEHRPRIQVFHRTFSIRAKRRRTAKVPNLLPSPSAVNIQLLLLEPIAAAAVRIDRDPRILAAELLLKP